jgi:hypothetical protein
MTINIDAIERCFAAPIGQQWMVAGDAGNTRGRAHDACMLSEYQPTIAEHKASY